MFSLIIQTKINQKAQITLFLDPLLLILNQTVQTFCYIFLAYVLNACFNSTGDTIATVSGDTLTTWNIEGKKVSQLASKKSQIFLHLTNHPKQSNIFAACGTDGVIHIADTRVSNHFVEDFQAQQEYSF